MFVCLKTSNSERSAGHSVSNLLSVDAKYPSG